MTEEEAKAAVIAAAETIVNSSWIMSHNHENIFQELQRCVAQYHQSQRRVFLIAHGEHANISLVLHNGRILLDYPNGEFTEAETRAMQAFRTLFANEAQLNHAHVLERAICILLEHFQRLERVGPWL